jgi:hypothetical protein
MEILQRIRPGALHKGVAGRLPCNSLTSAPSASGCNRVVVSWQVYMYSFLVMKPGTWVDPVYGTQRRVTCGDVILMTFIESWSFCGRDDEHQQACDEGALIRGHLVNHLRGSHEDHHHAAGKLAFAL